MGKKLIDPVTNRRFDSVYHDGVAALNESSASPGCSILPHKNLGAVIEQCAGSLPDGWVLGIGIEQGAAWVELFDGDGDKVEPPDSADRTLSEQVIDALNLAISRTT